jgi:hypothetical protein
MTFARWPSPAINASAGRQDEQPWLVKSSTTTGPAAAPARPPSNVAAAPATDSRAKVLRDMSNGLMATI